MTPWQVLGVARDIGVSDLRRRYATLIKEFRPETHPQDFARIREAYEVALPSARRREEALADEADDAVAAPADDAVAAPADDAVAASGEPAADPGAEPTRPVAPIIELRIEAETSAEVDTDEARPTATGFKLVDAAIDPPDDDEPPLAARFRNFHAAAASATGTRDEVFLPELRDLLQARARASLDDSQALEFALMRWLVESEAPPLTLLFETGRVFDWHAHPARLASWLSPWALRQLETRLGMSRDLVYARHFSGNRWLRRLHSPRFATAPVPFRPAAVEAMRWAERWEHASEDADAEGLASSLDARTLKRLDGLASTDLLVGLAVGATMTTLVSALAAGGVATALVFGARLVRQRIDNLPHDHRLRVAAEVMSRHWILTSVACVVLGVPGVLLIDLPEHAVVSTVLGCVLATPLAVLMVVLVWRLAALVELLAAWGFHWREAVDRLEFDRVLHGPTTPEAGRPFGARWGIVRRWRSIGAALRLQAMEVVARARPPRVKPFALAFFGAARGKASAWRVLWFVAWVLFAVMRLAQTFGGQH